VDSNSQSPRFRCGDHRETRRRPGAVYLSASGSRAVALGTGPAEYDEWATTHAQAYPSLPLTPAAGERALQVQRQLAHRGLHRAAKLPDLLIAAIAETAGAIVLHYDSDYEHINEVTGQPAEWIVPRGSID
jgi:predicted nucleic acid-binding protein